MRRTLVALMATVTGLIFLLSFKSHGGQITSRPAALAPVTPGHSTPKTKSSPAPQTATSPRTVTGDTVQTNYGPVQVRVTLVGSRLTDVQAIQLPTQSGRDIQIDNYAVPQLRSEALSAQSANINVISGATYTSDGYAQSLQSALDRARV